MVEKQHPWRKDTMQRNARALLALVLLCLPALAAAQVYDGIILYSTIGSRYTYLKDTSWQTVHSWTGTVNCAYSVYLMPDSSIWRGDVYSGASMRGAAYGGLMQRYDWDGDIVQSFIWSNSNHQQHHGFFPMNNGRVLLVSWDRKTNAEAKALGRQTLSGDIWPDEVIEYDPAGDSIAWEWHFWDHLIQDVDSTKPNYGVVAEHPELLDINVGNVQGGDWMHCNTIDYNAERDEIVLSSHNLHELFVIDHSTTTAEAAGHTGGRHGRGGDLLYRWGNSQNYDRGTSADRVFYVVHGGNWIRPGMPGAGDIIILNNGDRAGSSGDSSSVVEITPPIDSADNYYIRSDSAFGPTTPTWTYSNGRSFYAQHLGGAYRLANGNTLAILGTNGVFDEITPSGQIIWTRNAGGQLGHPMKYPRDSAAGSSENPVSQKVCSFASVAPIPFVRTAVIRYQLASSAHVRLTVHDAAGRVVRSLVDHAQAAGTYSSGLHAGSDMPSGVYFARLKVSGANGDTYAATRLLVRGR
jgi:hypothetical protein